MKTSGIITLTTDFGLVDPYVAMMKGVILTINPGARIMDITHQIRAGAIGQAARLIRETFSYYPKGTIHVGVVDPGVGSDRRPLGIEAGGHFFVGPDNGIFWPLIEDEKGAKIIHLTEDKYFLAHITRTFHGREVFAPVAAHLSRGIDLDAMGQELRDPLKLHLPKPAEVEKQLVGQITHVDNFGNLITNIHQEDLKNFLGALKPVIEVGVLVIRGLRPTYADGREGEPVALINSSGWLEIAVNLGRASRHPGLASEQIVGTEVKVGRSKGLS